MAPQLPFQIIFNPPKWGIHGVVLETLQHPATTRLYIHVSALMATYKPLNYPTKEKNVYSEHARTQAELSYFAQSQDFLLWQSWYATDVSNVGKHGARQRLKKGGRREPLLCGVA
jgi:hypothetical protein